jgi:hypothetical protein
MILTSSMLARRAQFTEGIDARRSRRTRTPRVENHDPAPGSLADR